MKKKSKVLFLVCDWWHTDGFVSVLKPLADVESTFVCLCDQEHVNDPFQHVKSIQDVKRVGIGTDEYFAMTAPGKWDVVWLLSGESPKMDFVLRLDKTVKVVWSTSGADYLRSRVQWLYGPRTFMAWIREMPLKAVVKDVFLYVLCLLRVTRFLPHNFSRFMHRVDYITSVVPGEERLIRVLVGSRSKWFPFHYTSRLIQKRFYPVVDLSEKNVVIGNSAYWSCNHFDLFALVEKDLDYQVWSPLSYTFGVVGESESGDVIAKEGRRVLGERFHPITSYMPYKEYIEWLSHCAVFIFGNKRQQALGNISIALRMGGCVFLDPTCPVCQYYVDHGVFVYPLSRLKDGIDRVVEEFRPHQMRNMEIMEKIRRNEALVNECESVVDQIIRDVRQ